MTNHCKKYKNHLFMMKSSQKYHQKLMSGKEKNSSSSASPMFKVQYLGMWKKHRGLCASSSRQIDIPSPVRARRRRCDQEKKVDFNGKNHPPITLVYHGLSMVYPWLIMIYHDNYGNYHGNYP
jgi:hypothetical protein